jgi:hypothetical protein
MNRMSLIAGGQEHCQEQRSKQLGQEVEDDKVWGELDDRFSHSWRPIGPTKRLVLDTQRETDYGYYIPGPSD